MSDQEEEIKNGAQENAPESASEPASEEPGINVRELQMLSDALKESKEKYTRLLAESENARKRMQKERQELTRYAVENVIADFLNPLDHFEKALEFAESASPEVKNWAVGFKMILGQLKEVVINQGVQEFKSLGTAFDPHLHEAVEMVETSECPPGIVIEECLKGYKMGDRTIRPARVKVSKAVSEKSPPEKEINPNNKGANS